MPLVFFIEVPVPNNSISGVDFPSFSAIFRLDLKLFRKYSIFLFFIYKLLLHAYFTQWHHVVRPPARIMVNVLLLVDITSVFVLVDLMVENVKVTKTQMWLFHDEVVNFCLCYKSSTLLPIWFVIRKFKNDQLL
jgi:hypothetical protein